jgi:methylase of polypeptide subunit release factors
VSETDRALAELLRRLDVLGYDFTTVTPATHARVLQRAPGAEAANLRDVFGWSLPFAPGLLPADVEQLADQAAVIERSGQLAKSTIRVSRIGAHLFVHSAYPTDQPDAVFFGPDTYRFIAFLEQVLGGDRRVSHLVDMGAGCGAGAICSSGLLPDARLTAVDCNPEAVRFARINADAAAIRLEVIEANSIDAVADPFDLLVANPPFMIDQARRTYRDGGGEWGLDLAVDWARGAARKLAPGGRMVLYTGTPIVDGHDKLKELIATELHSLGFDLAYREIDPDIFGEELESAAYSRVERIAAVGIVASRRD